MPLSPLRYQRLIHEIPKHKNAHDAVISAGFSESTARKQAKRVLQGALKQQAKEILRMDTPLASTSKQLMSDIVGLSRNDLMERLKIIATQDRDYNSALKVIAPLVREHGVVLNTEEDAKVQVPILNVTVSKTENAPVAYEQAQDNGSTEPQNDSTVAQ